MKFIPPSGSVLLLLLEVVAVTWLIMTFPSSTIHGAESPGSLRPADASLIPQYEKINTTRTLLSPDEIAAALVKLPGWKSGEGKLTKTFVLKNFVAAIAFINSLVPECERLDHHPEIFTVYNKVNLTLTTYDAGQRISSHDVLLAGRIEGLMAKAPGSP